jgi:hypothetical protein
MATPKKEYFKSGPKTIRKTADAKGEPYTAKRSTRKPVDFGDERGDRGERRPAARPYGYDRREGFEKRPERREPMHVMRKAPAPSPRIVEAPVAAAPGGVSQVVSAYKLKKGLEAAKAEIDEMVDAIAGSLAGRGQISEVELVVSFNADGKFMGFGAAGAATLKIRIVPVG